MMKEECKNCKARKSCAKVFDMHFDNKDCPFSKCEIRKLSEGEQNTCELCADYNMSDCKDCELNLKG